MNTRQTKGHELALRLKIERDGALWRVPSQSGKGAYLVDMASVPPFCPCPDYELRGVKCKHIYAVEYLIQQETARETCVEQETVCTDAGATVMTTTTVTETVTQTTTTRKRVTYRQDWPAYNAAQTHEKAHFQELLHALCQDIPDLPRMPGPGRKRLPLGEMLFAACFKVYSTISCRRFISDLSDATTKGYLSHTPHFNSIFNYLELPELTPILKRLIEQSASPLKAVETQFAVDSSGFSTCRFVRWYDAKYGQEMEEHEWIKAHVMTGVLTNIIASVEITDGYAGDSPQFRPLVESTARRFNMYEVSADKAYSSRENLDLVERHHGTPYIPFKVNATARRVSDKRADVWDRLYHYYHLHRETFLEHYHRRSLVESTFMMLKAKFGDALRSKSDIALINELLCKVLCHNLCCLIQSMYELGIKADFALA